MGSNYSTLEHMYDHCCKINQYIAKSSIHSLEDFMLNDMLQDSVTMRLLAIGELTTHISDDFKEEYTDKIDWRNLKQLRNVIAHRYGTIQFDLIWDNPKRYSCNYAVLSRQNKQPAARGKFR